MVDYRDALGTSWHDSQWIPILNANNVMDYFAERSNPFYDHTCNNELIKMQRINADLHNMVGLEYMLLHVQEPILYVIRKQHRHSASQVTPLADYYIIAGKVYQVPDLCSVINSRLTSTLHHLKEAFHEARSYSQYHPSNGYSFQFKQTDTLTGETGKRPKAPPQKDVGSVFQTQRVDALLAELVKKFPPKMTTPQQQQQQNQGTTASEVDVKVECKSVTSVSSHASDLKPIKQPQEKKPRLV